MSATNLDSYHRTTVMPETNTKILVCNAGSSSLKFSLFDAEEEVLLAEGGIDWIKKPTRLVFRQPDQPEIREELKLEKHADAAARILDDLQAGPSAALHSLDELRAVGHRVVHGGERYTSAVRITPEVKQAIEELAELAPLHNPASLDGITAVEQVLPHVPQVAAFDTAFHATLSEAARTYPVPQKWTRAWGIRRYGFHGLSHCVLQRPGGEDNRSARLAARYCASRERSVGLSGPWWRVRRYLHGFYSLGGTDDGDSQRYC